MRDDNILPSSWVVAAFVAILIATGCAKKEDAPKSKAQATKVEQKEKPNVSEAMSAFFRAHPRSDKVCYDANYDAFLVHYKDIPLNEVPPEDKMFGWYFVQKVEFYKLANNTWFTGLQPDERYFRAYPNVTGLPCQEIRD